MNPYSQDIRYAQPNINNVNNPQSLYTVTKPSRIIITDDVPEQSEGELLWYAIDQNTGVLYKKTEESGGQWQGIYNFPGGGSGITGASSVGIGEDVYARQVGNLLEFKTLVSQPQALESLVNIGEVGLNEVNITAPSTVGDIINYGTNSEQWIFDNPITDANGNLQYFAKYISGAGGITISTETIGSDKRLLITNTQTAETPSYINASFAGLTQIIPNSYVNFVSIWTQTEISSDWAKYTDFGSTWWRYVGPAGKKFKLSVDVYASLSALNAAQSFIIALAVGLPPAQNIIANTGIILEIPPDDTLQQRLYKCNGTLNYIFEPTVNELYTMQARFNSGASKSITFEQLRWTINKI